VPLAGVETGVGAAGGNWAISIGAPVGTNRAGSAAPPLVVASFTGIPLSRSAEPDGGAGKEVLFAGFAPA